MKTIRTFTLAAILLAAPLGTSLAQGMLDMLRQEQEQIEQDIQELEQLGSAMTTFRS